MGTTAHPRRRGRLALAVLGVVAALPLATATQAQAANYAPPYDVFNNCPVDDPGMLGAFSEAACIGAVAESGSITIGKLTTQLGSQLTSMGIYDTADDPFVPVTVGGNPTIAAEPAKVPGGLLNVMCGGPHPNPVANLVRTLCRTLIEDNPLNVVTATAEPAGTPTFVLEAPIVPIKIKLSNPLLGNTCYIGSDANPIVLNLALGITPDTGFELMPEIPGFEQLNLLQLTNVTFDDTTFSVPKANGCGLLNLLSGAINARTGLPSPSGANSIHLDGDVSIADSIEQGGTPGVTLRDALASVAQ